MEPEKFRVIQDKTPVESVGRRRALQVLFGGASAGLALPGISATHPVRRHLDHHAEKPAAPSVDPAGEQDPLFLSSRDLRTLEALADKIVPGSAATATHQFIDLLLSVETTETQDQFLRALAAFEGEALARFHAAFVDLSDAQQTDILNAAVESPRSEDRKTGSADWVSSYALKEAPPSMLTLGDFFDYLKGWIAGGYFSSEAGMKELGWEENFAFEDFPGCQHPEGHE